MLTAALAALASLEAVEAIMTSAADAAAFPQFEAAMQTCGGAQWKSYSLTNATGYNLTMFRLIGNELQQPYVETKGPVLLIGGIYSDGGDWIKCTNPIYKSMAVQLAEAGHDVWISQDRGQPGSNTHTALSLLDPIQKAEYWNYTFHEIGTEDIPAMVDKIIAERPGNCAKVTLIPHSSGVNAAMVAALKVPGLADKVGHVNAMGPCINVNIDEWFLEMRDTESIKMVYELLASLNVTTLFGPGYYEEIEPICQTPGIGPALCAGIFKNPDKIKPYMRQQSAKAYRHIQQNSVYTGGSFGEYKDNEMDGIPMVPYDVDSITIPFSVLTGSNDVECPADDNEPYFSTIAAGNITRVVGVENIDFWFDNSLTLVDTIEGYLPQTPHVLPELLCPAPVVECEKSDKECEQLALGELCSDLEDGDDRKRCQTVKNYANKMQCRDETGFA